MLEDIRLKAFMAVVKLGSFTAAAKELGVTQPAISKYIADLERYTGSQLLDRLHSPIELTSMGQLLMERAEEVLATYKKIEYEFKHAFSIVLKDVVLDGGKTNILIKDGCYQDLAIPDEDMATLLSGGESSNYKVMDCNGLAILPAFYNTHTHAAMTLLRGYADDMPLHKWLNEYIWPFEANFKAADIRKGSEIAIREMIGSGTCFFNDMYFDIEETIKEVEQRGLRAAIGITMMENHSKSVEAQKLDFIRNFVDHTSGRIQLVMAPHAIYTVGTEKLKRCASFARRHGIRLHIHLSETLKEVEDCYREHGMSPVKYLDSIGFLGPDVIAAHCVHVDEKDWKLLAKRGVTVSHCPVSNMKLGSGRFPYELALDSGCRITLGTDGASSNNCLDMLGEMKTAALLAKVNGDPTLLPAEEVFKWASLNGAQAFGINAGEIAVGKLADAVLVDLNVTRMTPCHNMISNMVYSADSSVIRYTLCEGRKLSIK